MTDGFHGDDFGYTGRVDEVDGEVSGVVQPDLRNTGSLEQHVPCLVVDGRVDRRTEGSLRSRRPQNAERIRLRLSSLHAVANQRAKWFKALSPPEAAYGGPVYDLAGPDPVLAWVTFPDRALEVEARVIAHTDRAVLVEWGFGQVADCAWVWREAVRAANEARVDLTSI